MVKSTIMHDDKDTRLAMTDGMNGEILLSTIVKGLKERSVGGAGAAFTIFVLQITVNRHESR